MGIRTTIQEQVFDRAQLALDRGFGADYQPMPWLGRAEGSRSAGTADRWALIEPELARIGPRSAVDIGCNVGFFTLSMAQMGVSVVGIESERRFLRLAQQGARRGGFDNVAFLDAHLTPGTMWQVPSADVVLLLSVHHHWVRHYGSDEARRMLEATWARADRALLFDTGEGELPEHFGADPLGPDPEAHLREHLTTVCVGSAVRCLGTSRAFAPGRGDERTAPAARHLFLVERV